MPAPFREGQWTHIKAVDLAHRIEFMRHTVAGQLRFGVGFLQLSPIGHLNLDLFSC